VAETSVLKTQQTKSPGFSPRYFQPKDLKLHSYETQQDPFKSYNMFLVMIVEPLLLEKKSIALFLLNLHSTSRH
jgi:hypothetical protein